MQSLIKLVLGIIVIGISGIAALYFWVDIQAAGRSYTSVQDLPERRVGLLLGTASTTMKGKPNEFYTARITATASAYKAGKIKKVLVSGDNRTSSYNEPRTMFRDLVAAGVNPADIVMDFAGFRTFDSMVRAKMVFGLESVTVISQEFHTSRAIAIGRAYDMDVIAYQAESPSLAFGFKVYLREIGARVVLARDLIFGNEPHFLGEQIKI